MIKKLDCKAQRKRIKQLLYIGLTYLFAVLCPNYCLAAKLDISSNEHNTNTFVLGDTVVITFTINDAPPETDVDVIYTVTDQDAAILISNNMMIHTDKKGSGERKVFFPSFLKGYYAIQANLSDGTPASSNGTRPEGMFSYVVVIDPKDRRDYGDRLSRFGMQGGFSTEAVVIPLLGIRHVFQEGSHWSAAEEDYPGKFLEVITKRWEKTKGLTYRKKPSSSEELSFRKMPWRTYATGIITAGMLPSWALSKETLGSYGIGLKFSALKEEHESDFSAFCSAFSKAFAHDYANQENRYYQVTWEPFAKEYYNGTSEQLVKMYKLCYGVIHENDPNARVSGPTLVLYKKSTKQIKELINAGFGNYIDAFSLHAYHEDQSWPIETTGFIEDLRNQLGLIKNATGKDIPFISTEHGYKSRKMGDVRQALANIRSTIILLGEGAEFVINFYITDHWEETPITGPDRTWGFYWNNDPDTKFGSSKISPKPVVPAYAAMTEMLDGTVSSGKITFTSGTQMGYQFTRDGQTILVIWDYGKKSTLSLPEKIVPYKMCNWMGNCTAFDSARKYLEISGKPIYVFF
jgi:hypothetical protein